MKDVKSYLRLKGKIANNPLSPSLGERIHQASFNCLANIYVAGSVLDAGALSCEQNKDPILGGV